jgi:spore germination protein KA
MNHRPNRKILRKMLRKIGQIKMEFSAETNSTVSGLSKQLHSNLQRFKAELHFSTDLIIRQFTMGINQDLKAAIVYIDGLVDKKQIEWSILKPLMAPAAIIAPLSMGDLLAQTAAQLISVGEAKEQDDFVRIVDSVLAGSTALFIDGSAAAVIINTPGWEKRSIIEPEAEVNIRGSKEGFIETLRTNTAMLRRAIGHPDLTMIQMTIGEKSKTDICIAYLKGIAPDSLITEIQRRLKRIKTDLIVGSGGIEQFIQDHPLSLFSTIGHTERPDVAAAKIAEGRAAILIDSTPYVLTMPFLFVENFQYPDDYNFHFIYATLIRWVRYAAFLISFAGPAAYVALISYHQELLPTPLLIAMAAATEATPFPRVVEVIGMGFIFEIIREGGIRLPRPIGQAISIVGALVIGQATVQAGFVAAPTVIVIATTAVTTFLFPSLVDETAPLRILLVVITGFLGAFGLMMGLLVIMIHLTALRSFGVPYLTPLAPLEPRGLAQDVLIRAPWWMMWKRPWQIAADDARERQQFRLMPRPPKKGQDESSE